MIIKTPQNVHKICFRGALVTFTCEVKFDLIKFEPGRCGRVVSMSACQAGGLWLKSSILPLLKHTCGESDCLLCWLYTLAEVSHQR